MKKKTTSLRRRRNQKAEIDELASHFQSSTPTASAAELEETGTSDNIKTSAIDKLSVLRLTTAFLKFQNFLKDSESIKSLKLA
jgi:type II secretory pathway component PulM